MAYRRLPVYLLIDVSGSMDGEPIQAVSNSVYQLVADLRANPWSLETVWLSVIIFSDDACQVVQLTDMESFQVPELVVDGGMTALGSAISLLCECRDREVVQRTLEHSGDYLPIVMILTDGQPTVGDFDKGIRDFKAKKWGKCVCCAIGPDADVDSLRRISDNIVELPGGNGLSSDDLLTFFKNTLSL